MVSRIVLLAAVAVAPAVQAFTPGQLAGAWYCESDGAIRWRHGEDWEKSPDGDKEPRIFYFQDPDSDKNTLLEGSMYREWDGLLSGLPDSTATQGIERLDRFLIRGTITSATTASVYLLPTLNAIVANNGDIDVGKPGPTGTDDEPSPYASNRPLFMGPGRQNAGIISNPLTGAGTGAVPAVGAGTSRNQQLISNDDIYRLFQVDADHFTLEPPVQDFTGSNYVYLDSAVDGQIAAGRANVGFGASGSEALAYFTISTEKCVRGLPRKSKACSYLHKDDPDADTLDSDEANRACRGNLYCIDEGNSNSNFKGECDKHKCCSAAVVSRGAVASPSYYQPPFQYQNSYYPQYSSNFYGYNFGR